MFLNDCLTELKMIFKTPPLLTLTLVAPLLLSFWFGGVYLSNYLDHIPVAILDADQSGLSRQLVSYIAQNERVNVVYHVDKETDLVEAIEEKKVSGGIYIKQGLAESIKKGEQGQVLVLCDGTNTIIGSNVYAAIATIVQTVSAGASIKVIGVTGGIPQQMAKNIALSFNTGERMLFDPKMSYMSYLTIGYVTIFIQQLTLSALGLMIYRNRGQVAEKRTLAQIFAKLFSYWAIIGGMFSLAIICMQRVYHVPITGSFLLAYVLATAFVIALIPPILVLASIFKTIDKYAQFCFMMSMPLFLTATYVWPIWEMPKGLLVIVRMLWPFINFSEPFQRILVKGASFHAIQGHLLGLAIYTVVWMPVALFIFKKAYTKTKEHDEGSLTDSGQSAGEQTA